VYPGLTLNLLAYLGCVIIMVMPSLRRNRRVRALKHKPEVVTGNFELHYEDIVKDNRFAIITIFATGLVLLAVFIPGAVYQSTARPDQISVEAEAGLLVNPEFVNIVDNDITASDDSYIEFRVLPPAAE
jgi:hypothetical protein